MALDPRQVRRWIAERGIPASSLFEKFRRDEPEASKKYTLEEFTRGLIASGVLLVQMPDDAYAFQASIGTRPLSVAQFRITLNAPGTSEDAKNLAAVLLSIMMNPD